MNIKDIACYGSVKNADYFIVCDTETEHILDNWHHEKDRPFKTFKELINYLLKDKGFNNIQEIGAE